MQPVDVVAGQRVLLLRLEDDTWDVQVFSIRQRFIDPRLNYPCIQDIASVAHGHHLTNSVLKSDPVCLFVLADAILTILSSLGCL